MPPRKSATVTPNEVVELREEVVELRQQVQLLSGIIDELREEVSWIARNGIPPHADAGPCPVLKRMALNPAAADWSERLVIERGTPTARPADAGQPVGIGNTPEPAVAPPRGFEPGDAVEFADEGTDLFGEIVSVDAANNEAVVQLIPSDEQIVVSLDQLILVEPDDEEPLVVTGKKPSRAKKRVPPAAKPPEGKLFSEPGDQPRLF